MSTASELAQLRTEVTELRALVDALTDGTAELRVRRLAIVDEHGDERIYAQVGTAPDRAEIAVVYGEQRVEAMAGPYAAGVRASTLAGPWIDEEEREGHAEAVVRVAAPAGRLGGRACVSVDTAERGVIVSQDGATSWTRRR